MFFLLCAKTDVIVNNVIETIKKSRDVETAKNNLIRRFKLTEVQAKAILDMRLQRLTGLERKKIEDEYRDLIKLIENLKGILTSEERRYSIIKEELIAIRDKYGDERRTKIMKRFG